MALGQAVGAIRQRLRNRPDTEHEQAILRPIVASVLFFYLVPEALLDPRGLDQATFTLIAAIVTYLAISLAIFVSVIFSSHVSVLRRLISATLDIATVTYFMAQTDLRGLPLSLAYLWITLANGFRFGPGYLLYSMVASVVGFVAVVVFSPFFGDHYELSIGLIAGMIAIDLYVLTLVKRMFSALARAEAANQAKRRFLSVVSHEMRTPLNAIIGMTDLLGESNLVDDQSEMVRTMTVASRALLRLVEDVLDFSKIEAGRLVVERTDFDLHALVNSTVRILRPQAEAKGLSLAISIMPEVPHALRGDPHHVRQVLINLIGNAVKFTAQGSVVVHLSATGEDENMARVKFSVRDTGIGIPSEVQDRIFESFVQADQSTTRKYGGTGLGTAIAKQLVELMGGRIGLESAVGLGSTFWFELEFAKQAAQPSEPMEGAFAGASVLVAGFPASEAEAIVQSLKGWGATPVSVGTIEAATQRLGMAVSAATPLHSALIYADKPETARHALPGLRRATVTPPLLLYLGATPRPAAIPPDLAVGFTAVLHMPLQSRLLFNALHAVSASEERDATPGVVRLRDYLQQRGSEGGLRVLVADDSATNQQVISKILERGGHSVTLVNDGEQVLDAIEDQSFDAIILDRNMPGMDGISTARALSTLETGRRHTPVVVLSADATQEAREECLAAGVDAFLPKPLEATRLLEQIAELCGTRAPKPTAAAPVPKAVMAQALAAANVETLRLLEELASQSGFIERLVATFVKDQSDLLMQMERAIGLGDFADFRRQIHAMKGSAASIGADRLADLCSRTQHLTDAEMERRSDLLETVRQEFDRARAALDRYLEEKRRTAG